MNRALVMALAAILASGSTAAGATAVVTSQLSGFQFQLVDLDPNDGIAPSIGLGTYPGSQVIASGDLPWTQVDGSTVFGPAQASATGKPGLSASAAITGDLSDGGSAKTVSRAADYPWETTAASAFFGSMDPTTQFTLSPHTELRMTGTADIAASTALARGFFESARGEVDFAFSSTPGVFDQLAVLSVFADNWDPTALVTSGHADLSLTFSNATDAPMQGGFYVYVWSLTSTGSAPIPEPSGPALMLAALGGMALMARGRRRPR